VDRPSDVTPGWFATAYSGSLGGRKRKDTKPELVLRRELHRLGLRYRLQYRIAPRLAADIAFPSARLVVWVDGCFWHGCPDHGRTSFTGPNALNWEAKMARNRARDLRAIDAATDLGWRAVRVWECDVNSDPVRVARVIGRLASRKARSGPS
jgi:DNA mismatch endonuclease (patch repair protein)